MQMLFELELMVGGEAVTGMAGNWQEIGQKLQPAATDLQIVSLLDKKFRGSGVNSKGFPLLKVFEVRPVCIRYRHYTLMIFTCLYLYHSLYFAAMLCITLHSQYFYR